MKELCFKFLEELREKGITNMYGAVPFLMEEFPDLSKDEATNVLNEWMRRYDELAKMYGWDTTRDY